MARVLNKISDAVNNVSKIVCGLLMGYLAIVCTLQVIFRKVLNNSLTWSEESMRYVFIWMILLATATTVKEGSGAAIDLLRKKCSGPKSRPVYEICTFMLTGFTAALLVYFGWQYMTANMKMTSAAVHFPMWIVYASVPVGSAITVLHCVNGIAAAIHDLRHSTERRGENK